MEKPTKRTVAVPYGHGFKTRPLEFYHPLEVDAYIAHLEQRAEAAEAKLAELKMQEPAAFRIDPNEGPSTLSFRCGEDLKASGFDFAECVPLFTRPAPAINLAELVPDSDVQASIDKLKNGYFRRWIKEYSSKEAKSGYVAGSINVKDIVNVFNYANACAAILRNIEEAK